MKKISILLFFLFSFAAVKAQVKQVYPQYGGTWKRLQIDSGFRLPKVIVGTKDANAGVDTAQLYYSVADSSVKVYTGSQFITLSGGGSSTDTTSLSNRINLKLNISDTATMLSNYINGVGYALLKSGQTVRVDSATLAAYFLRRKDSATGTNLDGYLTRTSVGDYVFQRFGKSGEDQEFTSNRYVNGKTYRLQIDSLSNFRIFDFSGEAVISNNSTFSGYYNYLQIDQYNSRLATYIPGSDAEFFTSFDGKAYGDFNAAYGVKTSRYQLWGDSSRYIYNNGTQESPVFRIYHSKFTIATDSFYASNIPSAAGTKSLRYDPSTGRITYADTTIGGSTPTWQQTLTAGSTLTGANTINGGDYNFTFGQMGLFTISQNNKSAVTGANGTNNVSPLTVTGGNGGATSYSTGTVSGGNAGSINITGGNGGAITGTPATGIGGTGGDIILLAGDGGLGTTNGGTAGNAILQGGTGGGGTAGGAAGYAAIKGGNAGPTGNADGGSIYLSPGIKNGSGADGHIFLGVSPSLTVRGSATIGSSTKGDSLFNIKDGGLYADRGVRFPNLPAGKKAKQLFLDTDGTVYAGDSTGTGGTGSGVTSFTDGNGFDGTVTGSALSLTTTITDTYFPYSNSGALANSIMAMAGSDSIRVGTTNTHAPFTVDGTEGWTGPLIVATSSNARVASINGEGSIDMTDIGSTPASPNLNYGKIYVRSDSLRFKNDGGTEFTLGLGGGSTSPAGNYGNLQLNRNGAFATPSTDSLRYTTTNGLQVKNKIRGAGGNGADSIITHTGFYSYNTAENAYAKISFQSGSVMDFGGFGGLRVDYYGNSHLFRAYVTIGNPGISLGTGNTPLQVYATSGQTADIFQVMDNSSNKKLYVTSTGNTIVTNRFEQSKGSDVASANDLTLGSGGNLFHITGTTTINAITTTNWQAGSEITLIFDASVTVKNNTAGGASTAVIILPGGADFSATADDVLTLSYDGTKWYTKSLSVN